MAKCDLKSDNPKNQEKMASHLTFPGAPGTTQDTP